MAAMGGHKISDDRITSSRLCSLVYTSPDLQVWGRT